MPLEMPPSFTENSIDNLSVVVETSKPQSLIYVVHPSCTKDCDSKKVVANATDQFLTKNNSTKNNIVVIAPPTKTTYLKPKTQINQIRTDSRYSFWVENSDMQASFDSITLVGGNLELCLGATFDKIKSTIINLQYPDNIQSLDVNINIPLESIYSIENMSAQSLFSLLFAQAGDLKIAAIALLTTNHPRQTSYGGLCESGCFEFIPSNGDTDNSYKIQINGQQIIALNSRLEQENQAEVLTGWGIVKQKKLPKVCYTFNLIYTAKTSRKMNLTDFLGRIHHAKKVTDNYLIS